MVVLGSSRSGSLTSRSGVFQRHAPNQLLLPFSLAMAPYAKPETSLKVSRIERKYNHTRGGSLTFLLVRVVVCRELKVRSRARLVVCSSDVN